MFRINDRYAALINSIASEELLELIDLSILDAEREREVYYSQYKCYPEQRDRLQKLRVDIETILRSEVK